jgi:hypothetical protein
MAHDLKIQLDEDTRLMLKAVRDDKAAYGKLYKKYFIIVTNYIINLMGSVTHRKTSLRRYLSACGRLAYTRSLGRPKHLPSYDQYYDLGNAYINLVTAVSHYCGLFFRQNGCFEPDNSSDLFETLNSLSEGSDEHDLAEIGFSAHCRGIVIAECLFSRYPTEKFKPVIRLSFEEARARLFYMTGVELLEMGS